MRRIFISLESSDGKHVSEKLDVSMNTTIKDMEKLTNQLINKGKENIPLSFYHDRFQLRVSLKEL